MPYEKVLEETMRRCEAYLKSQGKRRAGRGNVGKSKDGDRPYTFDDLVCELLERAGF